MNLELPAANVTDVTLMPECLAGALLCTQPEPSYLSGCYLWPYLNPMTPAHTWKPPSKFKIPDG